MAEIVSIAMIILSFRGFNILLPVGYDVQTVPEPLTILGAGSAIAFGTAFKRKLAKAKKQ